MNTRPIALSAPATSILDDPHLAVLATVDPDGRPQSSVIFVKRDGDSVLISTVVGRRKTRNMERDPRVSLLVADARGSYVAIRGTVEIAQDPTKQLLRDMYDRYLNGATPPPEPGAERVIVRVLPETVYLFPPAAS
ncbi:PPOX class F420-dependent oxidoreductase [Mycolicibacterium sp. P9-22]|uniref:PPOX class F420-dependent oxidoreductase n=1 Tax=Mycolicibacterium sp. P9-22 TaxID=2024613 RepID=UPI001D155C36|nr:PPOX class F420-dependent oxidoreductase [Mycolicibacterium sp. P9-22]